MPSPIKSTITPVSIANSTNIDDLKNNVQVVINRLASQINNHDHRFVSNINAQGNRLIGLPAPAIETEATNKQYVDSRLADLLDKIINLFNRRNRAFEAGGGGGGGGDVDFLPISGDGMTFQGVNPQVQGSALGSSTNAPLQIKGSDTVDGRVVLTPGAVAGTAGSNLSSITTQAQVQNQPAFIITDHASGSTNNLFLINDTGGIVRFAIQGANGPNPWSVNIEGPIVPDHDNMRDIGITNFNIRKIFINNGLDASSSTSGLPLQLTGANATDGRIVLTPGAVVVGAGSDKSSVRTQAQVQNQPGFIVQDYSGGSTDNLVAVLSAAGVVKLGIQGLNGPNPWSLNLAGSIIPINDDTIQIGLTNFRPVIAYLRGLDVAGLDSLDFAKIQGGDKSTAVLIVKEAASGTAASGIGVLQCQDSAGNITFQVESHDDPNFPDTVVMRGQHPALDNTYDMGVLSGVHGSPATSCWRDVFMKGFLYYGSTQTGAGATVLSNNCPAANPGSIFTWLNFKDISGNNLFVPAWK